MAVSLVFQTKEMRASRLQATRAAHLELMKLALDDPELLGAIGPSKFADEEERRKSLFVNLFVSNWYMSYQIGDLPEGELRANAQHLFAGEPGQQFWRAWGELRLRTSADKRGRRFHEILDEEYQAATQPPPPEPEPETPKSSAQDESGQEPPEPSR